jgi:hypothetical protein
MRAAGCVVQRMLSAEFIRGGASAISFWTVINAGRGCRTRQTSLVLSFADCNNKQSTVK